VAQPFALGDYWDARNIQLPLFDYYKLIIKLSKSDNFSSDVIIIAY